MGYWCTWVGKPFTENNARSRFNILLQCNFGGMQFVVAVLIAGLINNAL